MKGLDNSGQLRCLEILPAMFRDVLLPVERRSGAEVPM